jgi:peptide chain release factor 2
MASNDRALTEAKIAELEAAMCAPDFWNDSAKAQATIKELQDLKLALEGGSRYDRGGAILNFYAGAGGDDAEDWARMLVEMYQRFAASKGWEWSSLYASPNEAGGYRSYTAEVSGKNAYGELKHESGVHRLVRLSPFGAKDIRQTSFAMVEALPAKMDIADAGLRAEDVEISFTRSGGPGGQNVNKRETAVHAVHRPSGLAVRVDSERQQQANRDRALEILAAKLAKRQQDAQQTKEDGIAISKTTDVAWGNQIRSYVLHPYKLVKDHRTGVENRKAERVLEDGDIQEFIDAMKEGRKAGADSGESE